MAPPPKYLITRKLVKRFFTNYLPKEPLYSYDDSQKLFECWDVHGYESPKCREFELLYDHVQEENYFYRQRLKNMNFKSAILSSFKKPTYSFQKKGRYRKREDCLPRTIFDGVQ